MSVNHGANLFDISKKLGFEKKDLMDFSSNINPFGASSKAKNEVVKNIDMVSIYPDPNYKNLKNGISNYCFCNEENILLGSGATELISSFINIINPKNALLLSPAYSEYERELKKINCNVSKYFHKKENDFKVDVNDLINNIKNNDYELIIICNPNNPTGFAFSKNEIEKILKNTNCFIMVDETYIEFTDMNKYSSTPLVDEYNNLFVIRGTSKFFSTPGIRLGYGLISNKTVYENVAFAMQIIEASSKEIRRQVPMILGMVGLSDKASAYPHQLSGGERQRVSIARAIVNNPAILIADEPTGNLDPETAWEIMKVLKQINRRGTTIIMATHAKDIVDVMQQRVIALEKGRVVRDQQRGAYEYEA